ncbi:MAG: Xaa-Pro peptidase family protein [Bacteroidota bacterium]|nr:Xaa-Pro peptidase family protein [Bacteroidota bacterium]
MPLKYNFQRRIVYLRNEMQRQKIDAFISSFLPTTQYLCGYQGSNGLLVVTNLKSYFLTDFRYEEIIQTEVTADVKIVAQGSLSKAASKKKIFSSLKKVAFEKDRLTVAEFENLKKNLANKKLVPVSGIVENLRAVKDDFEIRTLKRAFDTSDKVFQAIIGMIKPGMTELQISAEISYLHKKYGAQNDAFDVIVASGVRGSLPHGTASSKKIGNGEFITLDFGCVVDGYHSDMTRTICVGKPTADMKKVYRIVLDAQQKACDAVRAGIAARKIDTIARKHIQSRGYGKYFGHSLGHGVGLEIHELPRIAPKSKEKLNVGHVITIEPGIYIPKQFGVRIEDTVVVRERGCEVLTGSPKELIII